MITSTSKDKRYFSLLRIRASLVGLSIIAAAFVIGYLSAVYSYPRNLWANELRRSNKQDPAFLFAQPAEELSPVEESKRAKAFREKFTIDKKYLGRAYVESLFKENNSLGYLYDDIPYLIASHTNYCPNIENAFFYEFKEYQLTCTAIVYRDFEFNNYAIKIQAKGNDKLLIYNHGHDGLPKNSEAYAFKTLKTLLNTGSDILINSMPFTGINSSNAIVNVETHDGKAELDIKAMAMRKHEVFELFKTGASHYMRFFLDGAVLPLVEDLGKYKKINYLGLSGGATTGLYTCALLKEHIDNCILVAGVMPIHLRLTPRNFGDAEQITNSFYSRNSVLGLIEEISKTSSAKTHLIFNDKDPCCFDSAHAIKFKELLQSKALSNVNFLILRSDQHNYDPELIRSIINQ